MKECQHPYSISEPPRYPLIWACDAFSQHIPCSNAHIGIAIPIIGSVGYPDHSISRASESFHCSHSIHLCCGYGCRSAATVRAWCLDLRVVPPGQGMVAYPYHGSFMRRQPPPSGGC